MNHAKYKKFSHIIFIKIVFLFSILNNGFIQAENNQIATLRQEYTDSHYQTYRTSREIKTIQESLDMNEYPLLPLSHLWKFDDDGNLMMMHHGKSPFKVRLYTFGKSEIGKMSYLVEEKRIADGSFHTMYSYTNTRQDVFTGARSQKPFKTKDGATYDAGHCIDHADTPDEELNFYGKQSTHSHPNWLSEPANGWGIKIRPHLVNDIRKGEGSYSQLAYYPRLEKRQYTLKPFKSEIPEGVLFFDHNNLGQIVQGWQIPWNDRYINYEAAGKGPRVKLRGYEAKSAQQEPIFSGVNGCFPQKLSYIHDYLDPNFSYRLDLPQDGLMDPLTQYRVEVLADAEMIPFYIPYLTQSYFKHKDTERGTYWANRMIEQARLLFDNDVDAELSVSSRNIINVLKASDPDHDLIDEFKSIIRDSHGTENSPSVIVKVEPESPKKDIQQSKPTPVIIRQKGNVSPPDFKTSMGESRELTIEFIHPEPKVTGGGKSAITKYVNSLLSSNMAYIQSTEFNPKYIELRGNPNMLSPTLLENIKKIFSKHPIRIFELPKPRRLEF